MIRYIINTKAGKNGYHEVHRVDCKHLPDEHNRLGLGMNHSANQVIRNMKHFMPKIKVDGCYYCCPECHKH